jgi:peptide-methionine (R)-S-oxide reductase
MKRIGRREFLGGGALLVGAAWLAGRASSAGPQPASEAGGLVVIENFSAAGKSEGTAQVPKIQKSDAEWRAQLAPLAFQVARQAGTEMPFSGEYDNNHADGLYHCVCCGTVLYDSRTKFDSGTGWPSFYRAISHYNVGEARDLSLGMLRQAVSCKRCDAHLGHVFDDGPKPTGLRYCMNSVSLHFVPRTA